MAVRKAKYESNANGKYLVLQIRSSDLKKRIPIEEVGKWACDHDDLVSDCERCWDCGVVRPHRHPPMNWALPNPMRKLQLTLAILLTLTLWGCVGQKTQALREEITSGDLSKFGIAGIQKIGDWYSFNREQLNIRIKISKASISRYRGFGNDLYFDDIEVIYPTLWTIRVIRTDGNLYVVGADTPKGSDGAAFFINLVGPIITTKDGQEWHFYRDRSKERIEIKWFRKDLYNFFHKSVS